MLGIKLWHKTCMPKRYLIVCGLVGMMAGLIELISFGWLMPRWTVPTASYLSTRWSKCEGGK